jgi:flagellar basal body rod protein FlgG
MIKGIYQSARSLLAANKNMEKISSNLANLNTVGFKREGMFSEILKSVGQSEVRSSVDTSQGDVYETKSTGSCDYGRRNVYNKKWKYF